MDIVTLALAKKGAKEYTDAVIDGMAKSLIYKGAVDYYNDLPNNAELGDCYTVRYKGSSGTEVSGAEYVWGKLVSSNEPAWIHLGEEIDLTDYVKNTDYATNNKGGVFKVGSNAFSLNANNMPQADVRTYENYLNAGNNIFIGKGTLENVLTARIGDIDSALDTINGEVIS